MGNALMAAKYISKSEFADFIPKTLSSAYCWIENKKAEENAQVFSLVGRNSHAVSEEEKDKRTAPIGQIVE
jgi:hypothetical protein